MKSTSTVATRLRSALFGDGRLRTIRLYPVRKTYYKSEWRYRTQVLGTVLVWAQRAKAVRVQYSAGRDEPFRYFDITGESVQSEFVQPPSELQRDLMRTLFLDTIDGHPLIRPIRGILRRCFGSYKVALLRVPDPENQIEPVWRMMISEAAAEFELVETLTCKGSVAAK